MKYFKKIEGERVYLSPINAEDAETYARWLNDPNVTDGHGTTSFVITSAFEKDWLETNLKSDKTYHFAIVKKNGDELIGNVGFTDIEHIHQTATIGLFIGEEENRGKGYGTEAVILAVKYGFNTLNLNNIDLKAFSFNERAIKAYAKAGFREYGRRSRAFYLGGEYHDVVCMEILRGHRRGNST
ncbi:MAG: GNAT family N-acetyltransferase [Oscillospiraceae bacterium]|nr:GNAT family N-acetyltransferase [Oscillospiraceae bacterium]